MSSGSGSSGGGTWNPASEGNPGGYPGGPGGSFITPPGGSQCCEDRICNCLSGSLYQIAAATTSIAQILNERLNKVCDSIDDCTDKILEKIKKRLEGPQYSCKECQRLVSQGMAGTLEYAIRCANQTCDECDRVCTMADPGSEGKCCKTCGKEKCICKDYQCVPVEEEEKEKKKRYQGWCLPHANIVRVTKQGDPSPGFGYVPVALADTEQAALEQAQSYCNSITSPTQPPTKFPRTGKANLPFCDLGSLVNGDVLRRSAAAQAEFFSEGGPIQAFEATADWGFGGITTGDISQILYGAVRLATGLPSFYARFASEDLPGLVGCDNPEFQQSLRLFATLDHFSKQTGISFREFMQPHEYAANAACRRIQLTPDQAMAAYLANAFDENKLDAYWSIHGICPEPLKDYIKAARSKPLPLQLAIMRHRQLISSSDYHNRMRELGYLDQIAREQLFQITYQVPTMTDILRFMVRDTDDTDLVNKFGLDTQFDVKYRSQLRKWSQDQGIPEQVARYAWRAHWTIPPPTVLFTFWHRLRNNQTFGGKEKLLADIKSALIQQDILPYWHEHYLAVSFRPMRLVDIRRSFQIGSLSDDDLLPAYQDLGYSDATADKMAAFTRRLRDKATAASIYIKQWARLEISRQQAREQLLRDGIPHEVIERAFKESEPAFAKSDYAKAYVRGDVTRDQLSSALNEAGLHLDTIDRIVNLLSLRKRNHSALKDFVAGMVTEDQARLQMITDGFDPRVATQRVNEASRDLERHFVVTCQNGIKRRFLLGEMDASDAVNELVNRKTVNQFAARLVDWWKCELKSGERDVSARTLCDWLARGAITSVEFTNRLKRIGYSDADSSLMVEDCLISISAKRLADAKKEARDQTLQSARIARALAQANAAEMRNANRIKAQREKAAATRARRQKAMMLAAEKVNATCQCGMNAAWNTVKGEFARVQVDYALTPDETLQVLQLAADEFSAGNLSEFAAVVSTYAENLAQANIDGKSAEIVLTNGSGTVS